MKSAEDVESLLRLLPPQIDGFQRLDQTLKAASSWNGLVCRALRINNNPNVLKFHNFHLYSANVFTARQYHSSGCGVLQYVPAPQSAIPACF